MVLEILTHIHVFRACEHENKSRDFDEISRFEVPANKKKCFGNVVKIFACVYACMCPLLGPERFDGLCSYLAFVSLSFIDRCPVNINILVPRIGALSNRRTRGPVDYITRKCPSLYNSQPVIAWRTRDDFVAKVI
jgi:hypothetical protein